MFDGAKIVVGNEFFSRENYASIKSEYYMTNENYELNGGELTYHIKEVEVYQIVI